MFTSNFIVDTRANFLKAIAAAALNEKLVGIRGKRRDEWT
jgi:hypothetical protein